LKSLSLLPPFSSNSRPSTLVNETAGPKDWILLWFNFMSKNVRQAVTRL